MIGQVLKPTRYGQLPEEVHCDNDTGLWEPRASIWRYLNSDGSFAKATSEEKGEGNLTGGVWGIVDPNGEMGLLRLHTVRENDDGTVSVLPGDGSSNSILNQGGPDHWHGYIYNNDWRSV